MVAIKCVSKSSLNKASTENLLTEIELLKSLKHEHIVELKDFQVNNLKLKTCLINSIEFSCTKIKNKHST